MSALLALRERLGEMSARWRGTVGGAARSVVDGVSRLDRVVRTSSPYGSALAVARSMLALSTLLTLVFTPSGQLFFRSVNYPEGTTCDSTFSSVSLFCVWNGDQQWLSYAVALVVLALVISGVAPAATAIPHWWVAWSFNRTSPIPDGGDQVVAVLTLLLVPLLVCDRRWNHWKPDYTYPSRMLVVKIVAYSSLVLIWVQAAAIYFHAAVGKFAVEEWANGTVLWYWFQDPTFSPPEPLLSLMVGIVGSPVGSAALGYGTLAVELALAFALVAGRRYRLLMLPLGVGFHLAIAVCFGLWSFSLAMTGLLLLYLVRPTLPAPESRIFAEESRRQKEVSVS